MTPETTPEVNQTVAPGVDLGRLMGEIEALAAFSDTPAPSVTRVLWTQPDRQARAFVLERFQAAGLRIRLDGLGNTFARWVGRDDTLPAVATGSHTDAIPQAGRYDGVVGVLGGLEAIRTLQAEGFSPARSLELILFTAEEPTRFGVGCLGSRAMSGALDEAALLALRGEDGVGLDQARRAAGFDLPLDEVRLPSGQYAAFVELHIEQGPELEREDLDIGVVSHIAAPASLLLHFGGEGGHAGARLMPGRRDALLAAAEAALALERATLEAGAMDAVGTAGLLNVSPNAINSIPSRVTMGLDLRDTDAGRRDATLARALAGAREAAARRGVTLEEQFLNADPPAQADEAIMAATQAACRARGYAARPLVSRAYHDALFMARLAPTGMIFIPCRGGVSHRPDEYSSPGHIGRGVRVLADVLAELSRG